MDIIDIILARAKSFTGETATLVQQAQAAMADANDIVDRLEAIEQQATDASEVAVAAATSATEAAQDFDDMKADLTAAAQELLGDTVDNLVDAKLENTLTDVTTLKNNVNTLVNSVDTLNNSTIPTLQSQITAAAQSGGDTVAITNNNTSAAKVKQLSITKNGQTTNYEIEKNYTSYGDNEDGSMTQKAIKNFVVQKINEIPASSGGSIYLDLENAGNIVIIGPDGTIQSGSTSEEDIIEALIKAGTYNSKETIGLEIDYQNKNFKRTQEAANLNMGSDFNQYLMYGGRMRCNVNDDGEIIAWYGDNNYKDDGSNGQVMIYQPKFYYQRTPITIEDGIKGKIIRKESLILSDTNKIGFRLHPLFIDQNNEELEYVLLPAYQGGLYNTLENSYAVNQPQSIDYSHDKLSSVGGVKPISGINNLLTVDQAEQLARNRGNGWHITNLEAESANQMLFMVEAGQLNGQNAIELGIVDISNTNNLNCASLTGSTSILGNGTGHAEETTNEKNGIFTPYSTNGTRAISYRGMENPWGNLWRFVGGFSILGNSLYKGGIPYICSNFNYNANLNETNYNHMEIYLPEDSGWISAMGYDSKDFDWIYIPIECQSPANSSLPVGDNSWFRPGLQGIIDVGFGGHWSSSSNAGLFYYSFDQYHGTSNKNYGANIMFIPSKNNIYTQNYQAWLNKMGG